MPTISVTCAIIHIKQKVLVVQRSDKMSLSLKWEFPGGKIKHGESAIDCIKREIREELNIEIELGKRLSPSFFEYPKASIVLIPFMATYVSGILTLQEHRQYLLLEKYELINLDWAEADVPILKEYINLVSINLL
ncbi:MAG: (deoxy)nucleoside triphosphate pyrophosphohydrolase [Sphingobacteriaceae bacterium]